MLLTSSWSEMPVTPVTQLDDDGCGDINSDGGCRPSPSRCCCSAAAPCAVEVRFPGALLSPSRFSLLLGLFFGETRHTIHSPGSATRPCESLACYRFTSKTKQNKPVLQVLRKKIKFQ